MIQDHTQIQTVCQCESCGVGKRNKKHQLNLANRKQTVKCLDYHLVYKIVIIDTLSVENILVGSLPVKSLPAKSFSSIVILF
jgi:hypothetical protein